MVNLNMVFLIYKDRMVNLGKVARIEFDVPSKTALLYSETGFLIDEARDDDFVALQTALTNNEMRHHFNIGSIDMRMDEPAPKDVEVIYAKDSSEGLSPD